MASQPVQPDDDREERVVERVAPTTDTELAVALAHRQVNVLEHNVTPAGDGVADDDATVRQVVGERAVAATLPGGRRSR